MAGYSLPQRIRNGWNVLRGKDYLEEREIEKIVTTLSYQYRTAWRDSNTRILAPIRTRIALDVANTSIRHVRLTEDGYFSDFIDSELDKRLTLKANIDQSGFAFILDAVHTMLDYGVMALVPIDVTTNPTKTVAYDILSILSYYLAQAQK